ncbi:MAG TPA: chemotaxis protein CheW [Kofleriaceae bacterium]|nr:chemotaxis protein CheW [Kofleriaceae bacterium]
MKNVIVFALGGARYAVELRWVREVAVLGFVTPVPTAPASIGGVANLRGAVTPVVDVRAALELPPPPARADDDGPARAPRKGDGAVVVDVDGLVAALWIDNVEQVATLRDAAPGRLTDARGDELPLLDAPDLVRRVRAQVIAARSRTLAEEPAGHGA